MIYVKECTVGGRFLITGPSRKSLPGVFLLSSFLHLSHTLMVSFLSSFWLPLLSTFQSFSVFFFLLLLLFLLSLFIFCHRGAWWAAVYGVAQSRTRLLRLSSSSQKQSRKDNCNNNILLRVWGKKDSHTILVQVIS